MSRINLPSEERIKSVDTTQKFPSSYEESDVIIDKALKNVYVKMNSGDSDWTKLISHDAVTKADAADPASDYDFNEVVFVESGVNGSNELKFVADDGNGNKVWQTFVSDQFISAVNITDVDLNKADFDNHDTFIGQLGTTDRGSIFSVFGGQVRYLRKNSAIKGVDDITAETIGDYEARDMVIEATGKIFQKVYANDTEWVTIFDPTKEEMDNVQYSMIGAVSNMTIGGVRQLFARSRGYSHLNTFAASDGGIPATLDCRSMDEIHTINSDLNIYWEDGRDPSKNRWRGVVGRTIFPKAEVYNSQKDTARSISFFSITNVTAQYVLWDSNTKTFTKVSSTLGIGTGEHVVHPDSYDSANIATWEPLYRDNSGAWFELPEITDVSTVDPTKGGFFYNIPADGVGTTTLEKPDGSSYSVPVDTIMIVVDSDGFVVADSNLNGATESDGTTPLTDTYLKDPTRVVPYNRIARIDYDSGTTSLTNSITIGYRQKAIIRTMEQNEADLWGADTVTTTADDLGSLADRGPVFLVSVESI